MGLAEIDRADLCGSFPDTLRANLDKLIVTTMIDIDNTRKKVEGEEELQHDEVTETERIARVSILATFALNKLVPRAWILSNRDSILVTVSV